VVAERRLELRRDARGQLVRVELPHDRAGHLAQDRELGDPEGPLGVLASGGLLEIARLDASCRISSTSRVTSPRAPSSAWRRSSARRTTSSRSWRAKGLIKYSKAPLVSACLTVSSDA